jgi:hypothetical protein
VRIAPQLQTSDDLMNALKAIVLALVLAFPVSAGDTPAVHWYQIVIAGPKETKTFTGSSPLEAAQISARLRSSDPIVLENLRDIFAKSSDVPMAWHPSDEAVRVFILPRTVLYFSELSGDPAAPK